MHPNHISDWSYIQAWKGLCLRAYSMLAMALEDDTKFLVHVTFYYLVLPAWVPFTQKHSKNVCKVSRTPMYLGNPVPRA